MLRPGKPITPRSLRLAKTKEIAPRPGEIFLNSHLISQGLEIILINPQLRSLTPFNWCDTNWLNNSSVNEINRICLLNKPAAERKSNIYKEAMTANNKAVGLARND